MAVVLSLGYTAVNEQWICEYDLWAEGESMVSMVTMLRRTQGSGGVSKRTHIVPHVRVCDGS
jgi:hypothetical protein